MSELRETSKIQKAEILNQIAELSRLLGMLPAEDAIQLHEPLTGNKMALSDWFDTARGTFLKLSLLISKEMHIELR